MKQIIAFGLTLALLSPSANAMDNGYTSGPSWIVPTALTATAFVKLLFTLLAVDRPETTEAYFQSCSANNLEPIFEEFFRDNRNFRNVRRQIHENLVLTELGNQVPLELYLQPVLCIGTGTHLTQIYSQPRGTIIAGCDVSIDSDECLLPHQCCDAWQVPSLPFNAFGCVLFAHAGRHPPFDDEIGLIEALTIYYCTLIPGGIFIYNTIAFEFAVAPDILAQQNGYNSFEEWKHVWLAPFLKTGFVDVDVMIKKEQVAFPFAPNAVSILLVARKE